MALPFDELAQFTELGLGSPRELRYMLGAVGAVLLLAGGRLYYGAVKLSSFTAGVLFALFVAHRLELMDFIPNDFYEDPWIVPGASLVFGVLCAWLAVLAHRVALTVVGFVGGYALVYGIQGTFPELGESWWPLAGAGGGILLMPWVFEVFLPVFTSLIGAVTVLWALGTEPSMALLGTLWAGGTIVQWYTGPESRPPAKA